MKLGRIEVSTIFLASAAAFTQCAVALQRTFAEREGEPLRVRVGLNAGEPIRSHDLLVCQADRSFTRVL